MSRLILQFTVILCFLSMHGIGQESYDLMTWKTEYTVRTHLLQEMHGQYDLRRAAIHEALKSKESMLAYRNECRQKYLGLLGQFPGKTPLNPQITKTIKQEGYRIENVLFESLPKHHVAANFYLPEGEGPFPAVIIFCGHEMTSKATESYQKTAILFAKNGFAALVVDPISQGEMVQFTDPNGERILRGSTTEHTLLNAGANLVGTGVVNYELYDNVGEEIHELFHLKNYILRTEGEIPLPCLVYTPWLKSGDTRAVIYLMEEGKSTMAVNDSLIESYMQRGDLLILADLRGLGETMEREDANEWKFYNREYHNAMISLHLGRSIVGQRVTDLFILLDFIEEKDSKDEIPVHLLTSGAAGPVAIYAALFRPQIKSVQIINSIRTYFDLLNFPMEMDWYSYVIPNVLAYFDLPDLAVLRGDLEITFQGEKPRIDDHTISRDKKIE